MVKLEILGSGSSFGVPVIGCTCDTCTSNSVRDKRTRTSALMTFTNGQTVLIDCGTDFRQHAINHRIKRIDYVLITHKHADHIFGIPDLIPLSKKNQIHIFLSYSAHETIKDPFAGFLTNKFTFHVIFGPFTINGVVFTPVPVMHGIMKIFAYRFGDTAYITDCSRIPEKSVSLLKGVHNLVINALCVTPPNHATHMSFKKSINAIKQIRPVRAIWIHMNYSHTYAQMANFIALEKSRDSELCEIDVKPGFDGAVFDFPNDQSLTLTKLHEFSGCVRQSITL